MNRKIFLTVVALILVCALALSLCACKKKKNAAEESKMEIQMHGKVGEDSVLNPAFDWTAISEDATYALEIKDEADEVVLLLDTTSTHYETTTPLEGDRGYTLTVTEKSSGKSAQVTFRTTAESGDLARTDITVADPFSSYMVLQRDRATTIKGTAAANALLTMEFNGNYYYAVSDGTGAYAFTLPAMQANAVPGDMEIRVLPEKTTVLKEVLIGDVYLASGQSNMWWKLRDSDYDQAVDVDNAIAADMRYYSMKITTSATPRDEVTNGKWSKISRNDRSYLDYSAVAFMTASMLASSVREKGVPVGIVVAAQGDTNIANWMSKEYYDGTIGTKNLNYNAMIHPLQGADFTGVIWYQGCNNSAKGSDYKGMLQSLIANWRSLFRYETLPFYIVQLPCYDGDSGNNYDFSFVRESQAMVCAEDSHAYLIATCDGGDPDYIHPTEKRYIAERLTKSILATIYGEGYLPQGPTYLSHEISGNKAIVTVENGDGLTAKGAISGFLLAGADGKYYDATAVIEGGKIVVTSDKVASPVYIKYGFSKSPFLNIYNKDGFLMSPFRTDRYNCDIDLLDYTDGAEYTLHPDGSAMTRRVVTVDGETGMEITKANDGKNFGSLQLEKWGAIGYDSLGMRLSVIGTNSGAKVLFRIVEGSYEIWAYEFTDDFTGKRDFEVAVAEFECVGNRVDGIADLQAVRQVEVTVKSDGAATITILGVAFVDLERSAPKAFTINEGREERDDYVISYTPAAFATDYRVIVSADGVNFLDPIVDVTTADTRITFLSSLRTPGTLYYVKVVARNELGETAAKNSGLILRDDERYVINHFDYATDRALQNYLKSHASIHEGLHVTLDERGVKITSDGKGWQYFVLSLDKGFNQGYDTLKFYIDVRDYHGSRIVIGLDDQDYKTFSYTLNTSSKREGFFEIPLSAFASGTTKYDGRDMIRLQINFEDENGGIVYLDDIELLKTK